MTIFGSSPPVMNAIPDGAVEQLGIGGGKREEAPMQMLLGVDYWRLIGGALLGRKVS